MTSLPCPICNRIISELEWQQSVTKPFCSERCRLIDIGRWLGEAYQLPAKAIDDEIWLENDTDEL